MKFQFNCQKGAQGENNREPDQELLLAGSPDDQALQNACRRADILPVRNKETKPPKHLQRTVPEVSGGLKSELMLKNGRPCTGFLSYVLGGRLNEQGRPPHPAVASSQGLTGAEAENPPPCLRWASQWCLHAEGRPQLDPQLCSASSPCSCSPSFLVPPERLSLFIPLHNPPSHFCFREPIQDR